MQITSLARAILRYPKNASYLLASFFTSRLPLASSLATPEPIRVAESPPIRPLRELDELSIAYFIHMHYPQYLAEVLELHQKLPEAWPFYFTVTSQELAESIRSGFRTGARKVEVRVTPNRGRNFGPLLVEFSKQIASYEFAVHLHSKLSPHSSESKVRAWSTQLWGALGADQAVLANALGVMRQRQEISYFASSIGPFSWTSWGNNLAAGQKLMNRVGVPLVREFWFPAGGMFLIRTAHYSALLAEKFEYSDFPEEKSQLDGCIHHAIERFIGASAKSNGLRGLKYDAALKRFELL